MTRPGTDQRLSDVELGALLARCRTFMDQHPAMWFVALVFVVVILTLAGF